MTGTFHHISRHFTSINNFNYFSIMSAGGYHGCRKFAKIVAVLSHLVTNDHVKFENDWIIGVRVRAHTVTANSGSGG